MLSRKEFVEYGDWVVAVTSADVPMLIQAVPSNSFSSKDGNFKTDDLVGVRYGGKVFNLTQTGSMVILHPTAYLWPNVVDFRTQILYQQDISLIQYFLDLKPGSVLIESGTGSGVLTTSLARSVAPHGHVHTFEFHPERVKRAQEDFKNNKVDSVVTCRQRDILERGFPFFPQGVDAAFLDLPAPHDVIPSVDRSLRPQGMSRFTHTELIGFIQKLNGKGLPGFILVCHFPISPHHFPLSLISPLSSPALSPRPSPGRICNFSPCIEQVQRVCLKLAELGYEEIFTVEILAKEYELVSTTAPQTIQFNQGVSLSGLVSVQGVAAAITGNQYAIGEHTFIHESERQMAQRRQEFQKQRSEIKKAEKAAAAAAATAATTLADSAQANEQETDGSKKQKTGQEGTDAQELCRLEAASSAVDQTMSDKVVSDQTIADETKPDLTPTLSNTPSTLVKLPPTDIKYPVQARPVINMRGHTGYLTFARKRASTQPKEGVAYATPFGQSKPPSIADVQGPAAQ